MRPKRQPDRAHRTVPAGDGSISQLDLDRLISQPSPGLPQTAPKGEPNHLPGNVTAHDAEYGRPARFEQRRQAARHRGKILNTVQPSEIRKGPIESDGGLKGLNLFRRQSMKMDFRRQPGGRHTAPGNFDHSRRAVARPNLNASCRQMRRVDTGSAIDLQDPLSWSKDAIELLPDLLALSRSDPGCGERIVVLPGDGIEGRAHRCGVRGRNRREVQASTSLDADSSPARASSMLLRMPASDGTSKAWPGPFVDRASSTSLRSNWSANL